MTTKCIQLSAVSWILAGKSHLRTRRAARAVHLRLRPIDEHLAGASPLRLSERKLHGRLAAMARRSRLPRRAPFRVRRSS